MDQDQTFTLLRPLRQGSSTPSLLVQIITLLNLTGFLFVILATDLLYLFLQVWRTQRMYRFITSIFSNFTSLTEFCFCGDNHAQFLWASWYALLVTLLIFGLLTHYSFRHCLSGLIVVKVSDSSERVDGYIIQFIVPCLACGNTVVQGEFYW